MGSANEVSEDPTQEYHKGEMCPYKAGTLCQEGYCNGCWIYLFERGEKDVLGTVDN